MRTSSLKIEPRTTLTIVALCAASVAFSLGFACAAPLAAFAALAAIRMNRTGAMTLVIAVWLVNQAIGFVFLSYPLDADCIGWGAGIGLASLLSLEAATLAKRGRAGLVLAPTAAIAAYEGALFAMTLVSGSSMDAYEPASIARVIAINAIAFAALMIASLLARGAGLGAPSTRPEGARPAI